MTLTEFSYYSRKMAPLIVILILVILIFFAAFQLLLVYFKGEKRTVTGSSSQTVTPTIAISPAFNKISAPQLADVKPSNGAKYVMDTIDGQPITATSAANVYLLPKQSDNFGYLSKIYLMARAMGFDTDVTKHRLLENKRVVFYDGLRKLIIDITDFNFNYQYTITKDNTQFQAVTTVDTNSVEETAIEFLRKLDRYPQELAQGKRNYVYMKFNPDTNELSILPSATTDTNMVEVDFYRPDIGDLPVVSPKFFNSSHYVVLALTSEGPKVVRAQMTLYEKSINNIGVYPLKTGEAAWKELQEGGGLIVSGQDAVQGEVKIKNMYLAYLDLEDYQPYLQPVFVFLGEGNFVAYVPAITKEYLTP